MYGFIVSRSLSSVCKICICGWWKSELLVKVMLWFLYCLTVGKLSLWTKQKLLANSTLLSLYGFEAHLKQTTTPVLHHTSILQDVPYRWDIFQSASMTSFFVAAILLPSMVEKMCVIMKNSKIYPIHMRHPVLCTYLYHSVVVKCINWQEYETGSVSINSCK